MIPSRWIAGSSPRVRGTGYPARRLRRQRRFIPAGAGNRPPHAVQVSSLSVHPRGCGEQSCSASMANSVHGSSPRVRGTARPPPCNLPSERFIPAGEGTVGWDEGLWDEARFIPAGAGNSQRLERRLANMAVHARGCGEQTRQCRIAPNSLGSSPRVRGTGSLAARPLERMGFIPAGAGNRPMRYRWATTLPVHPRGCGEQLGMMQAIAVTIGSSPRVRGTADFPRAGWLGFRFIPAGAGNRD